MRPRILRLVIALILICAAKLAAHPPTAFVMDDAKNLYFTYWGGTWKLAPDGQLSKFHSNDFHFLTIDLAGQFASAETPALRITPSGSKPALFTSRIIRPLFIPTATSIWRPGLSAEFDWRG